MNRMNSHCVSSIVLMLGVLALALASTPRPALAQTSAPAAIEVTARLATDRVYINDSVDLTIAVEGSSSPDRPTLRLPEGVEAEFAGGSDNSSTSTSIINGRVRKRDKHEFIFHYRLTPTREGTFTIPIPDVIVAGRAYSAPPVAFTAVRPGQSDDFILRVEFDRRELFVGEPTRMRIVWNLGASVSNVSFSRLTGIDGFEIGTPRDRVPAGQRASDDRTVEVPMLGRTVVGVWGDEVVRGRSVRTLSFDVIVVPKSPGRHELGPMSVTFDVGARQRSVFDVFEDRSSARRASAMSDPITIDVKPLPEKGRPADFGGLVGSYTLRTMAEPKSVSVGDPITLKLIVDGPDPTSRVEAPDLARVPGFGAFKLSGEGWRVDSGELPGPRAFSTTVRVTDPKAAEIPAIEIPYFDPGDAKYKLARSEPLPLLVRPTREITAADAVGSGRALPLPLTPATSLDSASPGLVANAQGAWVLADEGGGLAEAVRSPLVAGVLIAPPLAFLGATVLRVRRERATREDAVIAHARREAVAALRSGSTPAPQLAASLRRYAGAVLRMNPDAVTPIDCAGGSDSAGAGSRAPRQAPELAAISDVLGACDAARFGNIPEDLGGLAVRALAALEGRAKEGAAS